MLRPGVTFENKILSNIFPLGYSYMVMCLYDTTVT